MAPADSRIETTHAGSLPRPKALTALYVRRSREEAVDAKELARHAREGTARSLGAEAITRECTALRGILDAQPRKWSDTFVTAPSAGIVAWATRNAHYATLGEYVEAVAAALRVKRLFG